MFNEFNRNDPAVVTYTDAVKTEQLRLISVGGAHTHARTGMTRWAARPARERGRPSPLP